MDPEMIRQQTRRKRLDSRYKIQEHEHADDNDNNGTPPCEDLIVFGYSANVFHPLVPTGSRVDLIELEADNDTKVDRYDIRHLLLHQMPDTSDHCAVGIVALPDPGLNLTRFAALENGDVPEFEVFYMDPEERRAYIEGIGQQDDVTQETDSTQRRSGIALYYDDNGRPIDTSTDEKNNEPCDEQDKEAFDLPFVVPDGMAVPKTQRHFGIVEHTARFIADQAVDRAAQMEIMIQGKQGTNPDFAFLNRNNDLHPFYQHLLWLMRTGLYAYGEQDDSSSSESEHEVDLQDSVGVAHAVGRQEQPPCTQPLNLPSRPIDVPKDLFIPSDRGLIDKVADLVAKTPSPASFERRLRVEKTAVSASYAFLSPFDNANAYYSFRRDCLISGADDAAVEKAVVRAQQHNQDAAALQEDLPLTGNVEEALQAKRRRLAIEFLRQRRS
ncbi:hypothetical protein COEREDRAFT_81644 [Coemansia reversa NRRL 1564]|uniref:SURP motif domain-containing protein n=1 Tax=Coemansia reversa (strain ATCC 12441 / NRRL 1564) TaxID=763665 RepID=A0A2G5BA96_COERN|nr:hypothetical protein COEREDRAFT_81644 [Coemansia reversa NRRL 1564]|eukprot:PIA15941.1 hypothetical protein COEREDRAFT_81644 [Coemansia reversa NRRL 1564]